jgi:RsiW-degrading membrane proteinase PrsW (M82 family)
MPAGIETPLMGLTLWLAFNATVYYCINSTTFAPGIGTNSSNEPTGRVQAALLAIYLVALIVLMVTLCPTWSYKPAPFEVFFYPLFYIGVLIYKMLNGGG